MTSARTVSAPLTALICFGALWSAPVMAAGGGVEVTADTTGLSILVDGADTGLTTPATVGNLAPGRHEVRVRGECRVGALLVDVREGVTSPVQLATAEGRGLLTVETTPAGATVEVDGNPISGPTPVLCGSHSVRVSHPGFLAAMSTVHVDVDERRVLPLSLEELGTATLVLSVTPEAALVSLDGRALGSGSITDDTVPAGPHILELQAEGFKPVSQQLMLEAGDTKAFTFELDPVAVVAPPAPAPKAASTGASSGRMSALKATGVGLAAAGVGLGVFGATRFGKAATAYNEYVDRAENGPGPEREVNSIRDDQVVPLRNAGFVTTSIGTALLAGGLTMVVVF